MVFPIHISWQLHQGNTQHWPDSNQIFQVKAKYADLGLPDYEETCGCQKI